MIRIEVSTSNDAFRGHNYGAEIARILREIAEDMETRTVTVQDPVKVRYPDINGNMVCKVEDL